MEHNLTCARAIFESYAKPKQAGLFPASPLK